MEEEPLVTFVVLRDGLKRLRVRTFGLWMEKRKKFQDKVASNWLKGFSPVRGLY